MKEFYRSRVGAFLTLIVVAIGQSGCDAQGEDRDIVEGVDFGELFATPRLDEIAAIEAEWSVRDVSAAAIDVVREEEIRRGNWAGLLRIVTHRVGEVLHYGAIISPSSEPTRARPVLAYLHGDDNGISIDEVLFLYDLNPDVLGEFVVVLPSFRSEPLFFNGEVFRSTGSPSPWDYDVDDALSLVNVALALVAQADPERIAAVGFSRGATVALLMAVRDPRIDGVVEFFGATNFFDSFVQDVVRESLKGNPRPLPGLTYLNDRFIQPMRRKEMALAEARKELLRRSPVHFAARLPAVQIHHGLSDPIVPASEAEALIREMERLGAPGFEYFLYPGGLHHPLTLEGSFERAANFLMGVTAPPPA